MTSLVMIPTTLKEQPLYSWIVVLLLGKMSMFSIYSFYLSEGLLFPLLHSSLYPLQG